MTLRLTNQYVEVLGKETQDGEVRVTRQYLSVLIKAGSGTVHTENITQNLGISDSSIGRVLIRDISSTLNLTSNVSEILFIGTQNVSNTLSLSDVAAKTTVHTVSVLDTLNLQSKAVKTYVAIASSTLSLTDSVFYINYVEDRKPAGNVLNFTQTVLTLSSVPTSSTLNFAQTLDVRGPISVSAYSFMGLTSHTSTPFRMWIEDLFLVTDRVRVPIVLTPSNTLNFVDIGSMSEFDSSLGLTQTVTWGFAYWVSHDLGISDVLVYNGTFRRSVDQDLGIDQSLTWLDDTPCNRKQYSPFQGESTDSKPSDSLPEPQGSLSDRLSLYQPALGVKTSEVILRAPEMDNRDRNAYNRVSRETKGGRLVVYANPEWPKVRTLAFTIVGLTQQEGADLQTFIQDTVGEEIGLTDWEGNLWIGIIVDPSQPVIQDGKEKWTATFEFEGELANVELPGGVDGVSMNLSQSVSAVIV